MYGAARGGPAAGPPALPDSRNPGARLSSTDYYGENGVLSQEKLGIDLLISPERECAWEVFQLLNSEAAADLVRFAEGRLQLVGLRVREGAPVAGLNLVELNRKLKDRSWVTVAIVRDGVMQILRGVHPVRGRRALRG